MANIPFKPLLALVEPLKKEIVDAIRIHGKDLPGDLVGLLVRLRDALDVDATFRQKQEVLEAAAGILAGKLGIPKAEAFSGLLELSRERDPRLSSAQAVVTPAARQALRTGLVLLKAVYERRENRTAVRRVQTWVANGINATLVTQESPVAWDDLPSEVAELWIRTPAKEATFTIYPTEN